MNQIATKQAEIKSIDAEAILVKAIENNVSVEALERLLAMRERIKADQAKSAYYQAMSSFQAGLPQIKKEREVKGKDGNVRYRYASLDDIVSQVSTLLKEYGLSFEIKTEHKDGFIVATCVTHHVEGHSGESTFPVPVDESSYMNAAQKVASAQTYAKRYAFCNAFGIVTGDYDDDGESTGSATTALDIYRRMARHMEAVRTHWETVGVIRESIAINNLDSAAEAWEQLDNQAKMDLWLAPTKGGVFTTHEREIIHSDEFAQLRRNFAEPSKE